MPNFFMITNRDKRANGLGDERSGLSFWASQQSPLDNFANWKEVSSDDFRKQVLAIADAFPLIMDPEQHEQQKHVTLFVHGYDDDWKAAVQRYESLNAKLFEGPDGLGLSILFTWPSEGMKVAYLPDRKNAADSGSDFADILSELYDLLAARQAETIRNPANPCRAKTSVIAHSMGNYLLQKAMQICWTRKNQPLLMSLINQLLMVAADVDNDLFGSGESVDKSDGDAIANLTYRVTALYTGRDPVLGLSAGLKHFGKRRLGRSGLDRTYPVPDNVWDVDCTELIPTNAKDIHSIYFVEPHILELMRGILKGIDRGVLADEKLVPSG
jgi:esterase/lipase superfamily enzyme